MEAAKHGRAVDLGGELMAEGEVLEDEAVAAEEGRSEKEQEERPEGHGPGG